MSMYKVAKKYAKGPEQIVESFAKEADAKDYIQKKLQEDAAMKIVTFYLLYELGELMQTYDQSMIVKSAASSEGVASSSSGKSSSQASRPTPMQTTLRPGGMPPSGFKSEDDKKKE